MKKSLIKNIFKEIIKTRRRFISIMIMAFLGVGFFAGLTASSPDMLDSLDSYTDNNNMYDINIISTLGLTDADITAIKNIDEVENAYGIQTKDSLAQINDKENVCKVIEYNENINTPEIIYGKLPANSNECLLDSKYTISENIENFIGKQIILNNNETDENNNSIFTQKTFTIVGIATTPIYISNERGNSSIGNGTISYFIYTKDDVINLDYYTEIGVKIKNTKELVTNNHKYTSKVNSVISKIESIKEDRQTIRYNELINTANTKLETSKTEYITKKSEVESELQNAEAQINQAKQDLQNAESTLKTNKEELEKIKELSEKSTKEALFYLIKELSEVENDIKWSTQKTIMFQTEIIKLTVEKTNYGEDIEERINKLEQKIESGDIQVKNQKYTTPYPADSEAKGTSKKSESKPKTQVTIANIKSEEYWPKVINNLKSQGKITLFTNLMNTKAVELSDVQLGIVGLSGFGKTVIEQPDNRMAIETAIAQETGKTMQIKSEEAQNIKSKNTKSDFGIPINIIEE